MKSRHRYYVLMIALSVAPADAMAQNDSVASSVALDAVEVKAARYASKLKDGADGRATIDMRLMDNLPQVLGNADPIHYSQMLPEIQTNGEYRGGINIQGCESSHNQVSIGSVPVYYPAHLLGFFSTFNTSHFDQCEISKFMDATTDNRLGGELQMCFPVDEADSLSGVFSVGLISSQGTVTVPLDKKTTCRASLRQTYINMLYGSWLSSEDGDVNYSFYDANVTLSHRLNEQNRLVLDYYGGRDKGAFAEGAYMAKLRCSWGNQLVGLHHDYDNGAGLTMSSKVYLTSYSNKFHLNLQTQKYRLPSSITDVGLKHQAHLKRMSWGTDVVYHHIEPQMLQSSGTIADGYSSRQVTNTLEASGYAAYRHPLSDNLHMEAGVRGTVYGSGPTGYMTSADPSVTFTYKGHAVEVFGGCAMKHQYLFQTGFSDAGLPTEFWLSSDRVYRPQRASSVSAGTSAYLFARRYKVTANVFYKRLRNQVEYVGNILDFVNSEYKLSDHLVSGKGENYGCSIMLNKCSGRLSGWVSYTYTHARRSFDTERLSGSYPANHERPHEINAVMTYERGKHWTIGSTFVYASGTPFTAADYLSLINGNIIAHYREHNANRLQPYCRLDLSVGYKWKPRFAKENGLNLSVYNATGRSNELFYCISAHDDGSFAYKSRSFIVNILPSISYYCKF